MMKKTILLLGLLLTFVGCAKDYYTTLSKSTNGKVGSLQIKISTAMKNVNLTIDDQIVAKDKFTNQIIVNNIPVGTHKLLISASGNGRHDLRKQMNIQINPGE